jgi:hypothetical protein
LAAAVVGVAHAQVVGQRGQRGATEGVVGDGVILEGWQVQVVLLQPIRLLENPHLV